MINKFRLMWAVLKSRNIVVITDRSDHSSVRRYDDKHFWAHAKSRMKVLEKQHYEIKRNKDLQSAPTPNKEDA